MKLTMSFNIKAVEDEDKSLYGIVRMGGKRGMFSVSGICAGFKTEEQRENLQLDTKHVFFYGNIRDLEKNYHREIPFSDQVLESFKDKPYAEGKQEFSPLREVRIGYVLIPVEDLQLEIRRKDLVEILISEAEERLPGLMDKLEKVKIKTDDPKSMRNFSQNFSLCPMSLRQTALQKGSFYKLSVYGKKLIGKLLFFSIYLLRITCKLSYSKIKTKKACYHQTSTKVPNIKAPLH